MTAGKVITGFSAPYIGVYANNSGTISYTKGRRLARGVDVSLDVQTSDDNEFYADNVLAESENGRFTGGTVMKRRRFFGGKSCKAGQSLYI